MKPFLKEFFQFSSFFGISVVSRLPLLGRGVQGFIFSLPPLPVRAFAGRQGAKTGTAGNGSLTVPSSHFKILCRWIGYCSAIVQPSAKQGAAFSRAGCGRSASVISQGQPCSLPDQWKNRPTCRRSSPAWIRPVLRLRTLRCPACRKRQFLLRA